MVSLLTAIWDRRFSLEEPKPTSCCTSLAQCLLWQIDPVLLGAFRAGLPGQLFYPHPVISGFHFGAALIIGRRS